MRSAIRCNLAHQMFLVRKKKILILIAVHAVLFFLGKILFLYVGSLISNYFHNSVQSDSKTAKSQLIEGFWPMDQH